MNAVTLETIKSIDPNYDRHSENINGSTVVDKSSGDIFEYQYDFSEYMQSLLNASMGNRKQSGVNATEYNVKGRIIDAELDHLDIPGPYQEYTEETLEAFFDQFDTVVKPSI